ncbi:MAG TPA: response regulator [Candidatus Hydrogenedentes bacterium]|nr:response regulator [Candidatus Hydrogenedentota bacterium]
MEQVGKILVVDDEAVIRELLSDILEGEGYSVMTAANGLAALDTLDGNDDFVLLFTDIMMPEMDGIALVREVRRLRPNVIPIVMTGYATIETARAAVKEGAYDYVLKPFSLSEIKLAVNNAFERHRLTNENARLREITELFHISEAIASIRDERALLDFVLRAALERVGAKRGSLMLTTADGQALEVAASIGVPEEAVGTMVRMGTGISGWVAQNIKPLLIEDIGKTPGMAEVSRQLADASFVSVPLERKHPPEEGRTGANNHEPSVLAVLNVNQKQDGTPFTDGDLKALSIVANHAAAAIENVRLIRRIEEAHLATLQSMARLLEAKDPYTHGHSERVRDYAMMAAKALGLSEEDVEVMRLAAALHDIGKVGVSDGVLNKKGPLTDEEWSLVKQHPVIGHEVLSPVGFLTQDHLMLVRWHHERIDGKGYPDGIRGDKLPMLTRIIGVADAYDAMSSSRAYRDALPTETILRELEEYTGTQFDGAVTRLFVDLIRSGQLPGAT